MDYVQYKIFLIDDYKPKHSLLILKIHHVMADGLSIVHMMNLLNDKPDVKNLVGLKAIPIWKKALIYLTSPYYTIKASILLLAIKERYNPIKRKLPVSGKKHGAICTDLNLKKIKQASKDRGCTVNDLTSALMSTAIHEYF